MNRRRQIIATVTDHQIGAQFTRVIAGNAMECLAQIILLPFPPTRMARQQEFIADLINILDDEVTSSDSHSCFEVVKDHIRRTAKDGFGDLIQRMIGDVQIPPVEEQIALIEVIEEFIMGISYDDSRSPAPLIFGSQDSVTYKLAPVSGFSLYCEVASQPGNYVVDSKN